MANYFRRYIRGYAKIARPLTDLMKGETKSDKKGKLLQWGKLSAQTAAKVKNAFRSKWTERATKAFEQLKQALMTAPVLVLPDFDKPFAVECDACETSKAVGAVLMQEGHPAAYMSAKLSGPEQGYSASDMEMMAVIYALREWRCYLEGQKFTIITDHQPNTYLDKATNTHTMKRRARWLQESQCFDYEWQYKPGKQNIADPVSRAPQHFGMICVLKPPSRVNVARVRDRRKRLRSVRFADEQYYEALRRKAVASKGGSEAQKPTNENPQPSESTAEESGDEDSVPQAPGSLEDNVLVGRYMVANFMSRLREAYGKINALPDKKLKVLGLRKDGAGMYWKS